MVPAHTSIRLKDPDGWVMYVSHAPRAKRLVVFVHGFLGGAVGTWRTFPESGIERGSWWEEADMLFVGYRSTRDSITGVAYRLRSNIGRFYPIPHKDILQFDSHAAREDVESEYDELYLVGHSLGGIVIRRAMADSAQMWDDRGSESPKPVLLEARVRLFSPASAGFRAAGPLGVIKATGLWPGIDAFLRRSSAYSDLQDGSQTLKNIRELTESLALAAGMDSLRASIVWASPDEVVLAERYRTDFVDFSVDGTTHTTVCKPRRDDLGGHLFGRRPYTTPWEFVETGRSGHD